MKKLVHTLLQQLIERKLTLSFAESLTCGLATHQLNIVKGTSEVLMGSVICYNEQVKCKLLQVDEALIKKHTAESRQVTDAIAEGLKKLIKADIHCGITGLAVSDGSETKDKPVGTVFITVLYQNKKTYTRDVFSGSPLEIKKQACVKLYKTILEVINKQPV